jgi:hypothetical protein
MQLRIVFSQRFPDTGCQVVGPSVVELEPLFGQTVAYCVCDAEKPGRLPVTPAVMGQHRERIDLGLRHGHRLGPGATSSGRSKIAQ